MNIDISYLSNIINSCAFTISVNEKSEEDEFCLLDVLGVDNTDDMDKLIDLRTALGTLKEKERELINLRYYKDYTQTETAKELNMSQVEVSRTESKILKKINHEMMV